MTSRCETSCNANFAAQAIDEPIIFDRRSTFALSGTRSPPTGPIGRCPSSVGIRHFSAGASGGGASGRRTQDRGRHSHHLHSGEASWRENLDPLTGSEIAPSSRPGDWPARKPPCATSPSSPKNRDRGARPTGNPARRGSRAIHVRRFKHAATTRHYRRGGDNSEIIVHGRDSAVLHERYVDSLALSRKSTARFWLTCPSLITGQELSSSTFQSSGGIPPTRHLQRDD